MSKYGNFKIAVPDFTQEKFVLKDQLEKEIITEAEYKTSMDKLGRAQLRFIARSNGGYKVKRKGRPNYNLTQRKEMHTQQLLDKALSEESKATLDTDSTVLPEV